MKNRFKAGLRPTPVDHRDIPLGAVAGFASLSALPREYTVAEPLIIKNQGDTDMCTGYALTAVSEDQEGVILDPFFTFGITKRIQGNPAEWGADLRSACKSATKVGFLQGTPARVTTPPSGQDRTDASLLVGVTASQEAKAKFHRKQTYAAINGPYDVFDNFRSALWQMRGEKRSIFTGCMWRPTWTDSPYGVVESVGPAYGFGHALKIAGWDQEFLLAQLSNGKEIGRDGMFLLSREVINAAFTFGGYTFMDMPREDAEAAVKKSQKRGLFDRIGSGLSYWWSTIIA